MSISRCYRKRDTRLEDALEKAKLEFHNYMRSCGELENWTWDTLHRLERKVEILEHKLWCANYNN